MGVGAGTIKLYMAIIYSVCMKGLVITIEQRVLDSNARKQLSLAATDV
jgi:hypothetical protein